MERLVAVPAGEHAGEQARREPQALKQFSRPLPLAARHTEADGADDPLGHGQRNHNGRLDGEATHAGAVGTVGQFVRAREADQVAGQELREHPREALPGRHVCRRGRHPRPPPAVCAEQIVIIATLDERAPVKIECLDDATLRLVDRGVPVGGGADRCIAPIRLCIARVASNARNSNGHDVSPSI